MRRGAGGQQQLEVAVGRRAQPGVARHRRLLDRVHGLAGPIVAGRRNEARKVVPEVGHGALVADDHARTPPRRGGCEAPAVDARGHDVGADVAEGAQLLVLGERRETSEPATRNVLEEDAFDGILRAESEDLVERGIVRLVLPGSLADRRRRVRYCCRQLR